MVKTVLIVALLVIVGLIWVHRERVFLRDPIATVYRDKVEQHGVQVFINGSNDVLVEKDGPPDAYKVVVEHWNQMPGTPAVLRCLRYMACLAEGDRWATIPLDWSEDAPKALRRSSYNPQVTMSVREVSFTAADGARMRVVLR